jgi:hypothetical protein
MKPTRPMLRLCATAAAVALFVAASPRASAETAMMTFNGTTGAASVSYTLNGNPGATTPGPYFWTASSPLPPGMSNPVSMFCIELTQGIPGGVQTFTVNTNLALSPTIGTAAKANAIQALYGNKGAYSDAAFQLALWELVNDGTFDVANPGSNFFTTGILKSTDPVAASAQALLALTLNNIAGGLAAFNTNYPGYELVALSSATAQDQLWLRKKTPGVSVPAPPAVLLAGFALVTFIGRNRLNRRKLAQA